MIRRLARGAFALGVIAAMLGLLAPTAAASGTWTQYNMGNGPWSTWTLSGTTDSYVGTSSDDGFVADQYSVAATSAAASLQWTLSTATNAWFGLATDTSDGVAVRFLGLSTISLQNIGSWVGAGTILTPTTAPASGQIWSVSWDNATTTLTVQQESSSGTVLQQWTTTLAAISGTLYPYFSTQAPETAAFGVGAFASGPPSAPTGLTATAGDGSVALSWTASSGASSYTVLESTSSGGTYSSVASGITGTTYTVTGLTNGTTYYFEVEAVNGSGTSSPSGSASATPSAATTPPATPSGLTATGGSGQVSLSWNTVTGATYYGVLRGSGPSGPFALIAKPAGTTYTDTGLQSTTTYYYEVEAVNSAGASSPSSYVSATTLAVTLVAQPFSIPSLADAGLWGAIGALFSDLWPPIVLALALMLFAGLGGGFISVVMRGADKVRGL